MCTTCGCSDASAVVATTLLKDAAPSSFQLDSRHDHDRVIALNESILRKNDGIAAQTRAYFSQQGIASFNLMSAPGSGKTTILERTIGELGGENGITVIEGDQATTNDAQRIRQAGADCIQLNTGLTCHIEADMIANLLDHLPRRERQLLFIENVGNLVCPALFDLGEHKRVVILSVTEGEDKPLKYPHIFQHADLVLLNKTDLLPYVDFSVDRFTEHLDKINHHTVLLPLSAKSGEGFSAWYHWLKDAR